MGIPDNVIYAYFTKRIGGFVVTSTQNHRIKVLFLSAEKISERSRFVNFKSRMNAIVLNIFEINFSRLIQYEILEKLVTFITLC